MPWSPKPPTHLAKIATYDKPTYHDERGGELPAEWLRLRCPRCGSASWPERAVDIPSDGRAIKTKKIDGILRPVAVDGPGDPQPLLGALTGRRHCLSRGCQTIRLKGADVGYWNETSNCGLVFNATAGLTFVPDERAAEKERQGRTAAGDASPPASPTLADEIEAYRSRRG